MNWARFYFLLVEADRLLLVVVRLLVMEVFDVVFFGLADTVAALTFTLLTV